MTDTPEDWGGVTHVEVRRWERIAQAARRKGDSLWSVRVFHGAAGATYHRAGSWDLLVSKMNPPWLVEAFDHGAEPTVAIADMLTERGVTYSVIRVARKCDLI